MKQLSLKDTVLVASMLFGMFFGAGNLIFPVHLGQLAGSQMWGAAFGFIVTGVGIPILAVAAIGISRSSGLQDLSAKVGTGYGYFFTCLLYLTIGPFFAIPRCATTSFTIGVEAMPGDDANASLALLIFSFAFFALVLYFSLKPNRILTTIGKVINPIFLAFLAVLVVAALLRPGAAVSSVAPAVGYETGSFVSGFLEGYNTMDAIAGLAFGIVVIRVIRSLGIEDDSAVAANTLRSGLFAGILMAVIYLLTILMGAQSRGLFGISDNGGIALSQMSGHYLGRAGSAVLAATITAACLKTSIALVTSCAETFSTMFRKTTYELWAVILSVFSFCAANVGLTAIIRYSIPFLMLLYPLAITLTALALCGRWFGHARCVYVCVTAGAFAAAVFDFFKTLPAGVSSALHLDAAVAFAAGVIPFFSLGLGWIGPSLLGLVIGLVILWIQRSKTGAVVG